MARSSSSKLLFTLFGSLVFSNAVVKAQNETKYETRAPEFQGFVNTEANNVSQCTVEPTMIVNGEPQYPLHFFTYPENGVPTVQGPITASPWNASISFSSGTNLLWWLVDSRGESGGVPTNPSTVRSGSSDSCLDDDDDEEEEDEDFRFSTNVTDSNNNVPICNLVHLEIHNGVSPYTLGILVTGTTTIFNQSLDAGVSSLRWYNDVPENRQFMFILSDSLGNYARSSPLYRSTSSSLSGCGNDPLTPPGGDNGNDNGGNEGGGGGGGGMGTGEIVGAAIGSAAGVALIAVALFLLYRRKQKQKGAMGDSEDTIGAVEYKDPPGSYNRESSQHQVFQLPPQSPFPPPNAGNTSSNASPSSGTGAAAAALALPPGASQNRSPDTSSFHNSPSNEYSPVQLRDSDNASNRPLSSNVSTDPPSNVATETAPSLTPLGISNPDGQNRGSSTDHGASKGVSSDASSSGQRELPDVPRTRYVQHEDGGALVEEIPEELPPSYEDRRHATTS